MKCEVLGVFTAATKTVYRGSLFPRTGRRVRGTYAFTLVELLVVIAVMSLLMSLLLPALGSARELGKRTVCLANLRGLGTAVGGYAQEYDNVVPYNLTITTVTPNQNISWDDLLNPYLSPQLTDTDINADNIANSKGCKILVCPSDVTNPRGQSYNNAQAVRSYGWPRVGGTGPFTGMWQSYAVPPTNPFRFNSNDVPRPAGTIMITDYYDPSNQQGSTSSHGFIFNDGGVGNQPPGTNWLMYAPSHQNLFNYLFADGHAEALQYKDTIGTGITSAPKGNWVRLPPY